LRKRKMGAHRRA